MIYIRKIGLPDNLRGEIIKICKSRAWTSIPDGDTKAIRNFFDNAFPKDKVKSILVKEQHGLCAYCMRRIDTGYHTTLEHMIPLSRNKGKALEYGNMVGVCDGGRDRALDDDQILCCDACKGEKIIHITPLDQEQMAKICYDAKGFIYTEPKDDAMEKDINETLGLNGRKTKNGKFIDTATELVKSRRDAYAEIRMLMNKLDRQGKCSSKNIRKLVQMYQNKERWDEFIGVKLFYLKKKIASLEKQGL